MKRLDGKVAIITGAGSGMGQTGAVLFAKEGAKVAIVDIVPENGEETLKLVKDAGGDAILFLGDASNAEFAEKVVKDTVEKYGKLDVLYNNLGVDFYGTAENTEPDDWDKCFTVNMKSCYLFTHFAIPELKKNKGGSIINKGATSGFLGLGIMTGYGSSKAAVIQFTRATAMSVAKDGIRVNTISPGVTATRMVKEYMESVGPEAEKAVKDRIPMSRFQDPMEDAYLALFLASDESTYITGQNIPSDGGWSAKCGMPEGDEG